MVNGFEEETQELTNPEKEIARKMAVWLPKKVGEANAVTAKQIIDGYNGAGYTPQLTGPRLRKIINYIRVNVMVKNLIATSKGYYIETDRAKIDAYVESLYQRADAIREVAKSFSKTIH